MYSQNNNLKPVSFCYGCQVLSNEANQLKQEVLQKDAKITRLEKIEGEAKKLYPILEKWETTGKIKYRLNALKHLKEQMILSTGSVGKEEEIEEDPMDAVIAELVQENQLARQENQLLSEENAELKRYAIEAYDKLQIELIDAYALISELEKKAAASEAAMAEKALENQASLMQNLEVMAKMRAQLDGLEASNKALVTEKQQVEVKLKESETKVEKLEDDIGNYLKSAKENALKVEGHREQQQKLVDKLRNEGDTMRSAFMTTQSEVKALKSDLTVVFTETSVEFTRFVETTRSKFQEFIKMFETRRTEEIKKVKQEVEDSYGAQTQELMNLRETCQSLRHTIQKSDAEKLEKKEEELRKHQEESKKKTELLEEDVKKMKIQKGKRDILFVSAGFDCTVEENYSVEKKKARLEVGES